MPSSAITGDIANVFRYGADRLIFTQNNQYKGVLLSDDKVEKLYKMYCGLVVQQYYEKYGNIPNKLRKDN